MPPATGRLAGKTAIITGSGRGQGRAAALLFASEGANVVVNDLDPESVGGAVASIRDAGGVAVEAVGDISDAEVVKGIVDATLARFGAIDVLYNNAGIGFSATERMGIDMQDVVSATLPDWDRIMAINLNSVFYFCKYTLPSMIERRAGSIINTASTAAVRGSLRAHAYAASKGGIVALTHSIAATYGPYGVRANAICPGAIDTEMIRSRLLGDGQQVQAVINHVPLRAIGTPNDVAYAALYLASDESKYVTSQSINVDGGTTP
jgi:NAD(P)-dependent dehydrogenase (short-subunit alcohol dehydrogenase family)